MEERHHHVRREWPTVVYIRPRRDPHHFYIISLALLYSGDTTCNTPHIQTHPIKWGITPLKATRTYRKSQSTARVYGQTLNTNSSSPWSSFPRLASLTRMSFICSSYFFFQSFRPSLIYWFNIWSLDLILGSSRPRYILSFSLIYACWFDLH